MASSFSLSAWAGLAILLFEAGVTVIGVVHPRVDRYYADYYISQTRPCWLTEDEAAAAAAKLRTDDTIEIGGLDATTSCFLLKRGWSYTESWGVWSEGKVADLELPIEPGKNAVVMSLIAYSVSHDQFVKVYADGVFQGDYFLPIHATTPLTINVPAGSEGNLIISFVIKHPRHAARFAIHGDLREIGIGLTSIQWR